MSFDTDPVESSNGPLVIQEWPAAEDAFVGDVLTITLPSGLVGTARVYPSGSGFYVDVELAGIGAVYQVDYSDWFDPTDPGTQTLTLTPGVKYSPAACGEFGALVTLDTVSVSHTYPDYAVTQTMSDSWSKSVSGEEDGSFNVNYGRNISPFVTTGYEEPVTFSASCLGDIALSGRPCIGFWTQDGVLTSLDSGSSYLTMDLYPTKQWMKLNSALDPSWEVGKTIDPEGSYKLLVKKILNDEDLEAVLVSGSLTMDIDEGGGHKHWLLRANSVQTFAIEFSWSLDNESGTWPFSNVWDAHFYTGGYPTLNASCEWSASLSGSYTGWVRAE